MARFPLRGTLVVVGVVALLGFLAGRTGADATEVRSYSAFGADLAAGRIEAIRVEGAELRVTPRAGTPYLTRLAAPPEDLDAFTREGVEVEVGAAGVDWNAALVYLLPVALMVGLVVWLVRRGRGSGNEGAASFGRSRARLVTGETSDTRFRDVAGVEEAKADLHQVVEFLKHPERFRALGARIPHGVLMAGPPGSGKTHLAKAIAGEAGVPFFSISGSDFVEMFVGVGAARVRDLFETAKKNAPCIVFIDEIDAVGRRRGVSVHGGNDEREQTLNALLVEMDGFERQHDVIVVAATNRPDVLDPALLRPGRFDRQVVVDAPDVRGREAILRIHARGKPLAASVDLRRVAQRTPGFVGADLENLLNEAALVAARAGRAQISEPDLDDAADRVLMGPERRSRVIGAHEKRVTAYHEAGHALAAHLLPHTDPVHKITIVPRGRAMGYVLQAPEEERASLSRRELLDRIAVALAGRAAEAMVFDDVTTGAQNDFQQATELARRMVTRWGMSERLGRVTLAAGTEGFLGDAERSHGYSDDTARLVDHETKAILDTAYARAEDLLGAHRDVLDRVVTVLLDRETLHADAFAQLVADDARPDDAPAPPTRRSRDAPGASRPPPGTPEPG